MTSVPRLQLLPAPGTTPGAQAVAVPGQGEQQVKPVLPAKAIHGGRPDHRLPYDTDQRDGDRRIGDRRLADRQATQARIGHGGEQGRPGPRDGAGTQAANGRLIAFSRLSSMPFMVQLLGQENAGRPATGRPETSLSGHRDAALLGSDIYRKAGGEPEFLPETATFVRLAI